MTRALGRARGERASGPHRRHRDVDPSEKEVSGKLGDKTLVLHIGLHKTASSYVQGLLAARRDDLLRAGVLYPETGIVDKASTGTRGGAGSGQALLSRPGPQKALIAQLSAEIPEEVSTVLVSSEEFSRAAQKPTPERFLARFAAFGQVRVVLVLRRQDDWIESFYKQIVDQYRNFETRPFETFLREDGLPLLDFHTRFEPWRDLVGPENFHVLSYDDLPDGAALCRRLLTVAGVSGPVLDAIATTSVPRYDSVRAIDTLGLRILNSYRLSDRPTRTRTARAIYDIAPQGDIELMSEGLRQEILAMCRPVNERIESEWFAQPVPGFRFASPPRSRVPTAPAGPELVRYFDQVIALCDAARAALGDPRGRKGDDDG